MPKKTVVTILDRVEMKHLGFSDASEEIKGLIPEADEAGMLPILLSLKLGDITRAQAEARLKIVLPLHSPSVWDGTSPGVGQKGNVCPVCGHTETRVRDVRDGIRRRECKRCQHRWNTKEIII